MKYVVSVITLIVLLSIPTQVENHPLDTEINLEEVDYYIEITNMLNEYISFKEALALRESSNDYQALSRSGNYWGKYQFGKLALSDVQIEIDKVTFISNHLKQETAFYELLCRNYEYLYEEIMQFEGYFINDIQITKSGILASAHLVGARSVKNYLHSNGKIIRLDGNRTSMEEYMGEFSHYNFNLQCETETNYLKEYITQTYSYHDDR